MKLPLAARAATIAALALAILVPIALVADKVSERQRRAGDVVNQFASETSGPQLVVGPILALTCEDTHAEERQVMRAGKAETITEQRTERCATAFFTPREFRAKATMPVETRHRGIYPIQLYRAQVELHGEFDWPGAPAAEPGHRRTWKDAYVALFVRDPRGIKAIDSSVSSQLLAGVGVPGLEQFTLREHLGAWAVHKADEPVAFDYRMTLLGTSSLQFAPVGERNEIRIASDWPHPSFMEAWSPDERRVDRDGFDASWHVTSVATGGEATWRKTAAASQIAAARAAGVLLYDPVNVYALSYRATQYGFLFVLFTFSALALAEVVAGIRLHPVQYTLVGLAIAVFFLLLIGLSEHVAFALAYAAASMACVALLVFYLRHPLGTPARAGAFLALFSALYVSLYVLLMSEDHALLLGSVMTFAVLACAMIATRRTDWTAVSARMVQRA